MARIDSDPRLPIRGSIDYENTFYRRIWQLFKDIAGQLNSISEGQIVGHYNARTSAPTTGKYYVGDFIKNQTPSELGTVGSKYVIDGWVCIQAGEPGTWVEKRFLTGN